MAELSEKQKRFCEEYLVDYNATQAAIRAQYSKKTAGSQGHDLLKKPEIQAYLKSKQSRILNKLEISQERTMQEIGRIAFGDRRGLYNEDGSLKKLSEMSADDAALISSLETEELTLEEVVIGNTKKVKTWDKVRALEMLAKHFKIFSDAPVSTNSFKFGYGTEVPV